MNLFIMRTYLHARFNHNSSNETGANMVEYVLLLAFIALIVIGTVKILGSTVNSKFSDANSQLG